MPYAQYVPDPRIENAIAEIYGRYGHRVSVDAKRKNLKKFGRNDSLASGAEAMIWINGGIEVLETGNDIDVVVSDNAADTQEVVIEGHIMSGGELTFVVQTATLNGTTNVNLTTPLFRTTRIYNNSGVDFLGTVQVKKVLVMSCIFQHQVQITNHLNVRLPYQVQTIG